MGFEHCYSHDCDLTSIFVANAGLWCWEASSVLLLVGRDAARGDWPGRAWLRVVYVRVVRVLGGGKRDAEPQP